MKTVPGPYLILATALLRQGHRYPRPLHLSLFTASEVGKVPSLRQEV